MFEKSKWIWNDAVYGEDEYAEFCDCFLWESGETKLRISVCGDYTLFVNGNFVASNQYGDFEHYKIYDELDITDFLVKGENKVCFLVWYFGKSGMRFLTETAGLLYEIENNSVVIANSSEKTLSRKSKAFISGLKKFVSTQLGYGFTYDATKEDEWLCGNADGFSKSFVIEKDVSLFKRPIKKHNVGNIVKGNITKLENSYLIDLGEEIVGLCSLSFVTDKKQTLTVSYGELLENGHVKRLVGTRDFSFSYTAKEGKNEYTNYMFRLACRYIEIESESPIDIEYVGIVPLTYSVKEKKVQFKNELDKKIYDICLNTLKLCMMEHYVDCPWREQCLYAFDAKNQMLAGYIAFEDGNFEYARANLKLMSKDDRKDKLLSICFPSGDDLTIPSFSLFYIMAVKEYVDFSGDISLAEEVIDKMESILSAFTDNMEDGLICRFTGANHWNFYDWTEYTKGTLFISEEKRPDFLINALMIVALKNFDYICKKLSRVNIFENISKEISEKTKKKFYNEKTGMFYILNSDEKPTELANSLAIIAGLADKKTSEKICDELAKGNLYPCSLSNKVLKYDALICMDKEKYKTVILDEIRKTYKVMLDFGSTTVWETAEGSTAFANAGSLCHGWSAIPIYYYDLLEL